MDATNDRLGRLLATWVRGCARAWPLVLLVAALLCAGSLVVSKHRLGINSNFDEMLDPELPFRRAQRAFIEAFPQYEGNLVLVVDADTPEDARAAATSFAAALEARPELFRYVHVPMAEPFLEDHAFYYLDEEELDDLALRLAEIQPFLGRLTRDPSLRGLFDMLGYALDEKAKGGEFDATPLLKRLRVAIDGVVQGAPTRMSWQALMQDDDEAPSAADRRQIVLAQAVRDYGAFQPAAGALAAAREIFASLPRDGHPRLRITGGLAMEHEELTTVRQGAEWIGLLTMILVGLVLAVGLRSLRLVLTSLLALVVGLLLTTAFAALAVGHLNPISVAFGVLYIGLGVDYAIHLTLRYREGIEAGRSHLDALGDAAGDVGSSLVLCTFTTAIGFYAFVPTAYRGVSELGLISGTGMFVGLFVSLTVLPALLSVVPYRRPPRTPLIRHGLLFRLLTELPVRHRSLVLGVCAGLAVLGLALLPFVRFDLNPLNLRDPQTESVSTFRDLLATSDVPPWSITLLAEDDRASDALVDALAQVPSVDKVIRLESYVPADQEGKAIQLEDLALTLGGGFSLNSQVPPPTTAEQREALGTMRADLDRYRRSPAGQGDDTAAALDAALEHLDAHLATHDVEATLDALETSLLATLPTNLARLDEAVGAAPFGVRDLPADLQARWRAPDGRRRVEVFPRDSVEDVASLRAYVEDVEQVTPDVAGPPVAIVASGTAIVSSFREALLLSLLAGSAVLFAILRRPRDVLLVLVPLVFAGLLTGAFTVLFDIPFNYANVIALPLLFGIGVDSGIHVVHRSRSALPASAHGNPMRTSTGRAVVFSALTTACSFGNLAFSAHPGTASMGLVLAAGVLLTLVATVVLLPALLLRRGAGGTEG